MEKDLERRLVKQVKRLGGISLKLGGLSGIPDRLILLPDGKIAFIEVKAFGEKPRALQVSRHELLRKLGFKVYVLDDEKEIGGIIDEIRFS